MLCLKAYLCDAVLGIHLDRCCHSLHIHDVLRLDLRLGLLVLGGLHVHDLHRVGFLAVLLDQCAGESNLHHAAPDLVVQLASVGVQKIDIVGKGGDYFFLLARFRRLGLHVLLYHFLDSCYHAGFRRHACREYARIRMNMDDRAVLHGQLCVKRRMLACLRHHHVNALLLRHAVHCVPRRLGAVLVVGDGVSRQLLAVGQYCLHCVADLVLHAKVEIFTVLHAAGAVHDSRGASRGDGVLHLPAFHVVQGVQLI